MEPHELTPYGLLRKLTVYLMIVASIALSSCSGPVGTPGDDDASAPGTNSPPTVTSRPVTDVDENSGYRYQVVATDTDGDDLTYSLARNPDWLSIDPSGLVTGTAPNVDRDRHFGIEVTISDGHRSVAQSYTLYVEDVEPDDPAAITIQGTLEDSETDTGRRGEIRAYRQTSSGMFSLIDSDWTDANGNFSLSFDEVPAEIEMQARLRDGVVDEGYIRTITLPGESAADLVVRAVPYTGLNGDTVQTDITVEQFRNFIIDTMDGGNGIHKWDLDELQGIEIINDSPTTRPACVSGTCRPGYFTEIELAAIRDAIVEDVGVYFDGRDVLVQIDGASTADSDKHYSFNDRFIEAHPGWVIVYPTEELVGGTGSAGVHISGDGYRYRGLIEIDTLVEDSDRRISNFGALRATVSHELAHVAFYFEGRDPGSHTFDLTTDQTVISYRGGTEQYCAQPCFVDRKAGKLLYEDTFPTRTRADDILGLAWRGEAG